MKTKRPMMLWATLVAFVILATGAWWRYQTDEQRRNFKAFPDGEVPRHIFPIGARPLFNNSQDVTIYIVTEAYSKPKQKFHRYTVLQQKKLSVSQIVNLRSIFLANAKRKGIRACCFWPQHGIRMRHQGQTLDFIISFKCRQIYTYLKTQEFQETFSIKGEDEFNEFWKSVDLSPEKSVIP